MTENTIREAFPIKLKYYMELNGKKRNDLVRDLKFKYTTIRDWEKGLTIPRMDKVEILAMYFNCSTSDLLETKQPVEYELSEVKRALMDLIESLSESEAAVLLASLKSGLGR